MYLMEAATGAQAAVEALQTSVNATSIWGEIAHFIPFIGVMVLVSLGYTILKKSVKGASKAKVKF